MSEDITVNEVDYATFLLEDCIDNTIDFTKDEAETVLNCIRLMDNSIKQLESEKKEIARRMRHMAAEFYSEHCENSTLEQIHEGLMNLNLDV